MVLEKMTRIHTSKVSSVLSFLAHLELCVVDIFVFPAEYVTAQRSLCVQPAARWTHEIKDKKKGLLAEDNRDPLYVKPQELHKRLS